MEQNKIEQLNIRNFCIIAHIDHGKSTLADRMLELTHTVEKREMKEQLLDQMDLERERGITIKLAPVRMLWTQTNADLTPTYAERGLLYEDLTYKIRGAVFAVKKKIGLGHKENIYQKALSEELKSLDIKFETEKTITVNYDGKNIGNYRPDFMIEDKIIIELKSLPFIGKTEKTQAWTYLKGSDYKLLLLINFGTNELDIQRIIYDTARLPRQSAIIPRNSASCPRESAKFILNLIDTPGHVDFSYEVSRSLAAVEGAVLLVDASQGIEAQTLSTLYAAIEHNLTIIPVVNKIDLPAAKPEETAKEIYKLIGCKKEEIIFASGKTGEGVEEILNKIIDFVPPPKGEREKPLRALIFDSIYDNYRGVVAYVRVFDGEIKNSDEMLLMQTNSRSRAEDCGVFKPKFFPHSPLSAGEIGYIVSGFKSVSEARVGNTITTGSKTADSPLPGYKEIKPYVYASIFCTDSDKYPELKEAINKLKLNDASLFFEPERSDMFGFGFRCGFLGLLHMDIVRERLEREFDLDLVITTPNVIYKIVKSDGKQISIYKASDLPTPNEYQSISEPWTSLEIITPKDFIGPIMEICQTKRAIYKNTKYLDENRVILDYEMPLSELIINFYDQLKSASEGYASLNYEMIEYREAELSRIDIFVAEDKIEALSFVVEQNKGQKEARRIVERLKELIPRQNFEVKIQAAIGQNIIAAEKIPAMRKDVTAKLYGGDVTRKNKLLDKQKKGKKKMKQIGKVAIPSDVFIKVLKNE